MELTLKECQKLSRLTARKYRRPSGAKKRPFLDIFVTQTGYGCKYAIPMLANEELSSARKNGSGSKQWQKAGVLTIYDKTARVALVPPGEAFNRQCGKRFAPFLHANSDTIRVEPHFAVSCGGLNKLRRVSSSTIDRLPRPLKGAGGARPSRIPVRLTL
jgi:hypothetical protein